MHPPPDLQTAPAHSVHQQPQQQQYRQQHQQQQQQQPETSRLEAANHAMSDVVRKAASKDTLMQSPCRSGQQHPSGCVVPQLEQNMHSPQQTEPGADLMSTSSGSPDRMAAAEPMTQDLVVSDSEDEAGMQRLQAGSACFSDLVSDRTLPERLCLNLSPDPVPELRQKAAATDGVLHSVPPHALAERTSTVPASESLTLAAAAAATAETVQQGSYDMLMHDTMSGPQGSPTSVSLHSPALGSPGKGAASGNKTDVLSDPEPCVPALTASTQADIVHLASQGDSPQDGNHPGKDLAEGSLPGEAACLHGAGDAGALSGPKQQLVAPTRAIMNAKENMPVGARHADAQVVNSEQVQQHLLDSHVPHSGVTAFLWSAVRHIVPQVMH